MITTTLNRICEHSPSQEIWQKLLAGLGKTKADDEPLLFAKILEIHGLNFTLWCCRAEPQYAKEWRLLAVKYARRVEHLTANPAVKNVNDVTERYANGEATDEELAAAAGAVGSAEITVGCDAAVAAACTAVWAAGIGASRAVRDAAWAALWAVRAAAEAAGIGASWAAARAAQHAAWDAELDWQAQEFLRVVTETEAREVFA